VVGALCFALAVAVGCVETVDDYTGLACDPAEDPCPSGFLCVASACQRVDKILEAELCNTDADCEPPLHCNGELHRCRPCAGDGHCATPPASRCTDGGWCVQCLEHGDCMAAQRCDLSSLICVGCLPGESCPNDASQVELP
jgi:hypothetical protein